MSSLVEVSESIVIHLRRLRHRVVHGDVQVLRLGRLDDLVSPSRDRARMLEVPRNALFRLRWRHHRPRLRDVLCRGALLGEPALERIARVPVDALQRRLADLVQHLANLRGGTKATCLDPALARRMGIGNSTGLGMAPFLVNHPKLFNNWVMARETAIARVRSLDSVAISEAETFRNLLARSIISVEQWRSEHPIQVEKLKDLRRDMTALSDHVAAFDFTNAGPWNRLFLWGEAILGADAQECLASLMLEPYGDIVDPLTAEMSDDNATEFRIDGAMTLGVLKAILNDAFGWALDVDWAAKANCSRLWYVSEEKLEPRLGERFDEPIADFEQPLAPGRDAASLMTDIASLGDDTTVTRLLIRHPEHRHSVRRVQTAAHAPYAEIRDNTIGAKLLPIDMLRCKLSFFGATHFDPRSDRWVRICLFGNAPYPEELQRFETDDWPYPPLTDLTQ